MAEKSPHNVADGQNALLAPLEESTRAERVEIHRKHEPMHGWREFLKEVGIIVLGVLIALSAEQTLKRSIGESRSNKRESPRIWRERWRERSEMSGFSS